MLDELLLRLDKLDDLLDELLETLAADWLDELLGKPPWESLDELLATELELPGTITSGSLDEENDATDELEPIACDIAELEAGSTLPSEVVAEDVATEDGIGLGCRGSSSVDEPPPPHALSMQARLRAHR